MTYKGCEILAEVEVREDWDCDVDDNGDITLTRQMYTYESEVTGYHVSALEWDNTYDTFKEAKQAIDNMGAK